MPMPSRRRRLRVFGVGWLMLAASAWVGLQIYEWLKPTWTLHSFDNKGMVWTNRSGEVLFVAVTGESLSGYHFVPAGTGVQMRTTPITYQSDGQSSFPVGDGRRSLFEDLGGNSSRAQ